MTRPTQVPSRRDRVAVAYGTVTLCGRPFQIDSASHRLCNSHVRGPTTPQRKTSAVWAISRSLAATDEIDFSFFSCGYLDVSVPRVTSMHLCIQWWYCPITVSGFPHSEIPGSTLVYSSPRLIAVFHVLHRLLVPRHPPCALSSLTNFVIAFITKVFRIVS